MFVNYHFQCCQPVKRQGYLNFLKKPAITSALEKFTSHLVKMLELFGTKKIDFPDKQLMVSVFHDMLQKVSTPSGDPNEYAIVKSSLTGSSK